MELVLVGTVWLSNGKSIDITSGLKQGLNFLCTDLEQGEKCCVLDNSSDLTKSAVNLQVFLLAVNLRAPFCRKRLLFKMNVRAGGFLWAPKEN